MGLVRGELPALREDRFYSDMQTGRFSKHYLVKNGQHIEESPKTARGRIVSLDPLTWELLDGFLAERPSPSESSYEAPVTAGAVARRSLFPARLPEIFGGTSVALARTLTIIEPGERRIQPAEWDRAFRIFDLLI